MKQVVPVFLSLPGRSWGGHSRDEGQFCTAMPWVGHGLELGQRKALENDRTAPTDGEYQNCLWQRDQTWLQPQSCSPAARLVPAQPPPATSVKTEEGAANSFVPAHRSCLPLLFSIWQPSANTARWLLHSMEATSLRFGGFSRQPRSWLMKIKEVPGMKIPN